MTQEKCDTNFQSALIRAIYTLLYLLAGKLAMLIIYIIAIFQFFYLLIFKKKNTNVLSFSKGLSLYMKDVSEFAMMNTEHKPWPFGNWKS